MLFLDMVRPLSLADGSVIHRYEPENSNLARIENGIHIFTAGSVLYRISRIYNIISHLEISFTIVNY